MTNDTNAEIYTEIINRTVINSTIVIKQMVKENKGVYQCSASNDAMTASRIYTLALKGMCFHTPFMSRIFTENNK